MANLSNDPRKELFLKALSETGNVAAAARMAELSRNSAYRLRSSDPDFAAGWEDALETATDLLAAEAWRRALEGVEEPRFHKGEQQGTVTKYSDGLLMFLLKAHRPQVYRDKAKADDTISKTDREIGDAKERLKDRINRLGSGNRRTDSS